MTVLPFRVPVQSVAATLAAFLLVFPQPAAAQSPVQPEPGEAASPNAPPRITLWYGPNEGTDQSFGLLGVPQRRVNILGNTGHVTGVGSLTYSLNGGAYRDVSIGPDTRRLNLGGDFNIDIPYQELNAGSNTVRIRAVSSVGNETNEVTVNVYEHPPATWPLPFTAAWSSAQSLIDSAQVVDGKWGPVPGGLRILESGYDRLMAVGDTTWSDYEVTVMVTVNGIDSTAAAFSLISGGPGVGILTRWKGHTNTPTFTPPITQPLSGYVPFGALGWFHWRNGFGSGLNNRWEILSTNGDIDYRTHSDASPLVYGVPTIFKFQVHTEPGLYTTYRFRAWPASQGEPSTWLMTWNEPLSGASHGSVLLLAHHVRATFGPLTVTPVTDSDPPVLSNVQVTPGATSAVVTWTTNEPATSRVFYGLTQAYGLVASDNQYVQSHSVQLAGLTPDTEYHFLAASSDWGGNTGDAGDRTFRTTILPPPPPPTLVGPADGATGVSSSPRFSWTRPATAETFNLQVATEPSFGPGLVVNESLLTDTSRVASSLSQGRRHYWRVRARNTGGEGLFSAVWQFVTLLPAPSLVSPANGAGNQPHDVTLRWTRVPAASAYHLQVAGDPSFATRMILDDPSIADTTRVVPGLVNGETYYWRVRSRSTDAASAYTGAWAFTLGLAAPVPVAPADNALDLPSIVTFRWNVVPFASSYGLQVTMDPAFASGFVVNDSLLADTSYTYGGLAPATVYYWRVRARNGGGSGSVSPARKFTTALPAPALVSPLNGTEGLPLSVTFRWGNVDLATGYWFELATDSLFQTGIVKNDTLLLDTARTVHGLQYGARYFWRVRARNGAGRSLPSAVWSCGTTGRIPDPVVLLEPATDAVIDADSATFVWRQAQPAVDRYWFELALDSLFNFASIDSLSGDTSKVTTSLLPNRRYWWRVRAHNQEGWGAFSPVRSVVALLSSVADDPVLPDRYRLRQNYPNPFNPSTVLEFDLPEAADVRLEVFNILGERVAILAERQLPAGRHREEFDARDLPSGVYLARLTTPGGAWVVRMVLMK